MLAPAVKLNTGLEIARLVPTFLEANVPPVTDSVRLSPDTSPVTSPPERVAPPKVVPPS